MAQNVVLDNKSLKTIDIASIIDTIYPVGAVYISTASTSPQTLFGGSWESIGTGRCLMGADNSHAAGTTAEAGLPNITGAFKMDPQTAWIRVNSATGAFYKTGSTGAILTGGGSGDGVNNEAGFDASRSSSIYGNSSTVQPPAYYVYMWRRIG